MSKVQLGRLRRGGFWRAVCSLALCLVVSGVLAGPLVLAEPTSLPAATVDIGVVPSSVTVQAGDVFTVDIYVYPNGQQVDTVDADLTFNPAYLEVLSVTGDPSGLPDELYSNFDNINGSVTHSRGILVGMPPSNDFRLCSIEFNAKAAGGTTLAFTGLTDAYFQGGSLLRDTFGGMVAVKGPVAVGGVGYLFDAGQMLSPWMVGLAVAGLILGAVVVSRRGRKVA
jgi:hypothetical protein